MEGFEPVFAGVRVLKIAMFEYFWGVRILRERYFSEYILENHFCFWKDACLERYIVGLQTCFFLKDNFW